MITVCVCLQRLAEAAALKSMPQVLIAVDMERSHMMAGGTLEVSFALCAMDGEGGQLWDEDDSLCVVCSAPTIVDRIEARNGQSRWM